MSQATSTQEPPPALAAQPNSKGGFQITRTELVWPGKYNEDGSRKEVPRVSLPFQVIETINESRATREAEKHEGKTLFDFYQGKEGETFEAGWKNKLIWGDNLLVMGSLLSKFEGKIDLIYIDPPFATGADFSFTTEVGDSGVELSKEQSLTVGREAAQSGQRAGELVAGLPAPQSRIQPRQVPESLPYPLHCQAMEEFISQFDSLQPGLEQYMLDLRKGFLELLALHLHSFVSP